MPWLSSPWMDPIFQFMWKDGTFWTSNCSVSKSPFGKACQPWYPWPEVNMIQPSYWWLTRFKSHFHGLLYLNHEICMRTRGCSRPRTWRCGRSCDTLGSGTCTKARATLRSCVEHFHPLRSPQVRVQIPGPAVLQTTSPTGSDIQQLPTQWVRLK